ARGATTIGSPRRSGRGAGREVRPTAPTPWHADGCASGDRGRSSPSRPSARARGAAARSATDAPSPRVGPLAGARPRGGGSSIGAPGFEPGTSPTRTVRATRLRHAPRESLSVASGPLTGPRDRLEIPDSQAGHERLEGDLDGHALAFRPRREPDLLDLLALG